MFRRTLAASAAALLAAVFVCGAALAARVHVRVEGKTQTIFGAAEPVLRVEPPEVSIPEVPRIASALRALEAASVAGEFYYRINTQFSFGPYVDQIGRFPAGTNTGWMFKVNGAQPPVGADKVEVKDGDRVLWYFAQFGAAGGPATLRLERRPGGCYRVLKEDDAGRRTAALGARLVVDGRSIRTRAGRACPGPHRGLVRALLANAVRSNAVR